MYMALDKMTNISDSLAEQEFADVFIKTTGAGIKRISKKSIVSFTPIGPIMVASLQNKND
jgi:hypothetical protein